MSANARSFDGRVALVTGAASGVGREVVAALVVGGARVGAVGRDRGRLDATVAAAGDGCIAVVADLRRSEDVERAVGEVVAAFGGLDLVAHVAGALRVGTAPELPEDDWDLLFDTNAKSCFLLAKHAIPALRERGGGAIVNVTSVYAAAADPGASAYAASKAAAEAFTRTIALDHAQEGIRVNAVAPGSMRTPMLEALARERSPSDPEAMLARAGSLHPLGRLIEPREVAELILYLLSDAAAAITGATYVIDGGRRARLGAAG